MFQVFVIKISIMSSDFLCHLASQMAGTQQNCPDSGWLSDNSFRGP